MQIIRLSIIIVLYMSVMVFPQLSGSTEFLPANSPQLAHGAHHCNHVQLFAERAPGYNKVVLQAIDTVQSHALDGGTYFIGIKAVPAESPLNYPIKLGTAELLSPPRQSSYCSGSTYGAFIETLNRIYPHISDSLSAERVEALRMQEPDGGRREDWVKFWGIWNADGFGSQYALEQYAGMGETIIPDDARPGDFANISWNSGGGHSVIFLGWFFNNAGEKCMLYWSSQKGTNGYGDQLSPLSTIRAVKMVRLTNPGNIFTFDITGKINRKIPGDKLSE